MELFDKKFVHCMWDDELEGKRCIVSDRIDIMIDAVDNGTYHTAVINRSKGGGYALHSNETGLDYLVAYYDPNYECKVAFEQGKRIQVKCLGTGKWEDCVGTPTWFDECEYRVKPEEHKLVFAFNGVLSLDTENAPCVLYTGTKEQCLKHAVDVMCSRCVNFNTCSPDGKCRGFKKNKSKKEPEKKWRPFKDIQELKQAWENKRGCVQYPELVEPMIWVRIQTDRAEITMTRMIRDYDYESDLVCIGPWRSLEYLFNVYEFLDGTPCGVEVEE